MRRNFLSICKTFDNRYVHSVNVKNLKSTVVTTKDPFYSKATEVIDVRSPDEYKLDHIPGAINLPVLNNIERDKVGKLYSESPFDARKQGAKLVVSNISDILESHFYTKDLNYKPLVYCWRGGQRSRSLATILSEIGFDVFILEGGYKTYRKKLKEDLKVLPDKFNYKVISGLTGSGKTLILSRLSEIGEQVLDLEGLAKHKGSMLGRYPDEPQPSNKFFHSLIREKLASFDPSKTIWMESESRSIGKCIIPDDLFRKLCHAKRYNIGLPINERVQHIMKEYPHWMADNSDLNLILDFLQKYLGSKTIENLKSLADKQQWEAFIECLLVQHYDPTYTMSQRKHQLTDDIVNINIQNLSDESMTILLEKILKT